MLTIGRNLTTGFRELLKLKGTHGLDSLLISTEVNPGQGSLPSLTLG